MNAIQAGTPPERHKVLFLDDDEELRRLVGIYLRRRGYEVTLAEELEEAGALLACRSYDVLCADLSLDSLGRFEALDLIAEARAKHSGLKIVVQTGSDDRGVHAACLARGADMVLVKGGTPEPLSRAIQGLLQGESTCAAV